jgi:hypothetical protein
MTFAKYLKPHFPSLLSDTKFIEVMPSVIIPLNIHLTTSFGKPTGITFIDSTKIGVCHIIQAKRNKVFNGTAKHGKGKMGWFFELHTTPHGRARLQTVLDQTSRPD